MRYKFWNIRSAKLKFSQKKNKTKKIYFVEKKTLTNFEEEKSENGLPLRTFVKIALNH